MILTEGELTDLARAALLGSGVRDDQAGDCARILVLGDMLGIPTHGVTRLPSYVERLCAGGINARARITTETLAPGIRRVFGDDALGPAVGMAALREAEDAARQSGIAIVFCRASNHFGAISPYALIAASDGFASLVASNATASIAPTGGREVRLGNNPIGFGFPSPGGDPLIVDMAISVAARGKIRAALKAGRRIPDSWATDAQGRPTVDPAEALGGFLQPIGAHKGFGLALAIDMLAGVLSGASYLTHVQAWMDAPDTPQGLGHCFVAIDVSHLGSAAWLGERVEDALELLRQTPPSDPARPVRVPGARSLETLHRARREGVRVDDDVIAELRRLVPS